MFNRYKFVIVDRRFFEGYLQYYNIAQEGYSLFKVREGYTMADFLFLADHGSHHPYFSPFSRGTHVGYIANVYNVSFVTKMGEVAPYV